MAYPAGFVRRLIAAYEDIAIERKVVGVDGVIYFRLLRRSLEVPSALQIRRVAQRNCLVNQLGLEGIVFRAVDVDGFPPINLLSRDAPLAFAIEVTAGACRKYASRTDTSGSIERTMHSGLPTNRQATNLFGTSRK